MARPAARVAPHRPGVDQTARGSTGRDWRQGAVERILRTAIRAWCVVCAWRLEVTFADNLPQREGLPPGAGCVVACAPHRAWVEPFLLVAAWPPEAARLAWVADARTAVGSRWRRVLLSRLVDVIRVGPSAEGPRRQAELAAGWLAAGAAVAVFPETGPPSPPDRARPVSRGFAYLAMRAGAPVVPVVIGGTHRIVRGSTFTVDVLDPIDVGPPDPLALSADRRSTATALAERYAATVAEVLPARTSSVEARRPRRDRWRWLGTMLR